MVSESLGALRVKLGHDFKFVKDEWSPLWVVDFPLFEYDAQEKRWQALHHPFTAPKVNDAAELQANPGSCLSRAYDMVLNGCEIGGCSILIHDTHLQSAVFDLFKIMSWSPVIFFETYKSFTFWNNILATWLGLCL